MDFPNVFIKELQKVLSEGFIKCLLNENATERIARKKENFEIGMSYFLSG